MNASCLAGMLACTWLAFTPRAFAEDQKWTLSSPSGELSLVITFDPSPAAGATNLSYQVLDANEPVLESAPLGITRDDVDFGTGLTLKEAGPVSLHDSTYNLVHGKRRVVRDHFRAQTLTFQTANGASVELALLAYDDGVAFRYRFPGTSDGVRKVKAERTGFRLPAGSVVWVMPYDDPSDYTPAYESYYQNEIAAGTPSPTQSGWAFPLVFRTPGNRWGLITEAGVADYCGTRLASQAPGGLYTVRYPDPAEGNHTGSVEPESSLPWSAPWRVVMAGRSPGVLIESTLVENVSMPTRIEDTSWIKPGRVSWSWLSDASSSQDCSKLKTFVDLAAEMGWEYTLVDANWDIMRNGTIHDLIAYARERGVGVMLWYNSGGAHNRVTERPRGLMDDRKIRRMEFQRLAQWGVKGVKVDFFQSDKQNIMRLYQEILEDAAAAHIMVNFHGCTLPRGWSRTFPNLMSMESVRGAENYQFEHRFPPLAPRHNATLPYTRNAVGPMDYTPTLFKDNNNPMVTTAGHEIALPVVFESGLLHFGGGVDDYRTLPEVPRQFLKTIPVVWDETRWLLGEPGKLAVIARRAGGSWFVGGINGTGEPSQIDVPLAFLAPGNWTASVIEDDPGGARALANRTLNLESKPGAAMRLILRANGGFAARIDPIGR